MNKTTAREFIGRMRDVTKGRLEQWDVGGDSVVVLIVTEPEKAAGEFLSPGIEDFDYDIGWYSAFLQEARRLVCMPAEERKKAKVWVNLPYMEGIDDQADAAPGEGLEGTPERVYPERPYWLG